MSVARSPSLPLVHLLIRNSIGRCTGSACCVQKKRWVIKDCHAHHETYISTGNVFERRLIEAYIAENGKDPSTGETLTTEDLIELKSSRIVKPRPPTLTSIPSLLSVFQNEWDALALETYTLRQQLAQTRQELSTALYQHDAAVRVIARLTRERDEARDALSKVTVPPGGAAPNGEQMDVDSAGLPEQIAVKVQETQEKYVSILFELR